jgi:DNA-directed RNA polymerase subunit L
MQTKPTFAMEKANAGAKKVTMVRNAIKHPLNAPLNLSLAMVEENAIKTVASA